MSCVIVSRAPLGAPRGARPPPRRRYVESEAWKGFRDSGRMRFAEFGTPLPLVQGVLTLLAGVTGLGQGARPGRAAVALQADADISGPLPRLIAEAAFTWLEWRV